jgi:hypothetical protein
VCRGWGSDRRCTSLSRAPRFQRQHPLPAGSSLPRVDWPAIHRSYWNLAGNTRKVYKNYVVERRFYKQTNTAEEQSGTEQDIQEAGEVLARNAKANKGMFSETLQIRSDGRFQLEDEKGNLKSVFACLVLNEQPADHVETLYRLAYQVHKRFPDLAFAFTRDKEGRSLTYTVRTPEAQQAALPPRKP